MRAIWQRNYAETLHQLALFPSGCEAMREQTALIKALEGVAERGVTQEAKAHAQGALMALSERTMQLAPDAESPKHIMLSYQVRLVPLICLSGSPHVPPSSADTLDTVSMMTVE